MKLFSRKALAAVATTVALTTAGLTAPAFAEENPSDPNVTAPTANPDTEDKDQDKDGENSGNGNGTTVPPANNDSSSFLGSSSNDDESSSKDMEAKEIREWVGVFTAVIGALSAAFVFIQRLTN